MEHEKKNYYEILEVPQGATAHEIDQAYNRAKNAYSGESVAMYSLMSPEECNQILGSIEEAYSIIGYPEKRREYDKFRGFNQQHKFESLTAIAPDKDGHQYEAFSSATSESKVSRIMVQKRFELDYKPSDKMEKKIEDTIDFTGSVLKEIRDYKNVTIERLADLTRVSKTQLTAVENEDPSKLPADVYVRGFVYQYAKVLKLNPEQVASSYMLHYKKMKDQKNNAHK